MSGPFEVQVSVDQALKKLVDFEPVTFLTASTIVTGEARKLHALVGLGVAMVSTGKKNVARVIDIQLHADPKKEGHVLGKVKLFAGGDVTSYVGLLIMLQPLQLTIDEGAELRPRAPLTPTEQVLQGKRKRKKKGAE